MQSLAKKFKNQSGLTLIETLIATAIGVLVLATSFKLFTAQQDALTSTNEKTSIRADGVCRQTNVVSELI